MMSPNMGYPDKLSVIDIDSGKDATMWRILHSNLL